MTIRAFDHVALPGGDLAALAAFYRALGCEVREDNDYIVSVQFGTNKINFHRPSLWQKPSFTLRAAGTLPGCGDLCFVWGGTVVEAIAAIRAAGASVEEGPIGREGGRNIEGASVYTRDPDGNLVELMVYPA